MGRVSRSRFTDEYKAKTVKLVLSGHKTAGQVARDLDLTETAVRRWVKQARVDAGKGPPGTLTSAEKEELFRLRKEVHTRRLDRRDSPQARGTACLGLLHATKGIPSQPPRVGQVAALMAQGMKPASW